MNTTIVDLSDYFYLAYGRIGESLRGDLKNPVTDNYCSEKTQDALRFIVREAYKAGFKKASDLSQQALLLRELEIMNDVED